MKAFTTRVGRSIGRLLRKKFLAYASKRRAQKRKSERERITKDPEDKGLHH